MKKAKLSTLLITLLSLTSLVACNPGETTSSNSNSGSISSSDSGSSESSKPSSSGSVIDLTAIKLNKTETSILLNSTETLTVTFTPNNATDKEVEWSSDDATIASVDNGVVTAKKIGVANITVKSKKNASISYLTFPQNTNSSYLSKIRIKVKQMTTASMITHNHIKLVMITLSTLNQL